MFFTKKIAYVSVSVMAALLFVSCGGSSQAQPTTSGSTSTSTSSGVTNNLCGNDHDRHPCHYGIDHSLRSTEWRLQHPGPCGLNQHKRLCDDFYGHRHLYGYDPTGHTHRQLLTGTVSNSRATITQTLRQLQVAIYNSQTNQQMAALKPLMSTPNGGSTCRRYCHRHKLTALTVKFHPMSTFQLSSAAESKPR